MKRLFIRIFGKPPAEYPAILVCLFMAGVIWFFNAMNKEYTTQIKYPVHFNFDEERLTSIGELPEKLKVNVTGQGWNLLKRSLYYNVKPVEIIRNVHHDTHDYDNLRNITTHYEKLFSERGRTIKYCKFYLVNLNISPNK
jgi:hypothetical protein